MEAIAHNKGFAKKVGIPQSVGQDFSKADKGKTFKKGGETMKSDFKEDMKMDKSQDKSMIKKAFKQHDSQEHKGGKGTSLKLKHGGMSGGMHMMPDGKMMKNTAMKKMAMGGQPDPKMAAMMAKKRQAMMGGAPATPAMARPMAPAGPAPTMPMKKGGKVKKMAGGGMTSMGKVKTNPGNINGVAERGLTKGKVIKMAGGGSGKKYC
jgi:hypothetical protein